MDTFWYLLKVIPGKERSMAEQFNRHISLGKLNNILKFICPTEKELVISKNKKIIRDKVIYSGYLYFETDKLLNDDELKKITEYQNVMGILGDKKPVLLKKNDIDKIIKENIVDNYKKNIEYSVGDSVIVSDGPFTTFKGVVSKIDKDNVDVEVKIFGRINVVSLKLEQVKLDN